MGTLYWQINDCWPVASWSSIDYCGRWKALQYYARDAYDEVLVSPYASGKQVVFKAISDRLQKMKGELLKETFIVIYIKIKPSDFGGTDGVLKESFI